MPIPNPPLDGMLEAMADMWEEAHTLMHPEEPGEGLVLSSCTDHSEKRPFPPLTAYMQCYDDELNHPKTSRFLRLPEEI